MNMTIEDLFNRGIIKLAKLPKDNELDINNLDNLKLLLIPIDHDYPGGSACMHNAVFRESNLNYRTAFIVADPIHTEVIINTFREDSRYIGGGVGSGFKDKAIDYLDELDESAKIIGSINVIRKENNKLIGYNTDGIGYVKGLLKEHPYAIADKNIVMLGAGGTGLAIAYEITKHNPKKITIINRTIEKAKHIAESIKKYSNSAYDGEKNIVNYLDDADLVINVSNKGAGKLIDYCAFAPITSSIEEHNNLAVTNLSRLARNAIVSDIILEEKSNTLKLAEQHGYTIHDGKSMNLYQAVPALKLMTGLSFDKYNLEAIMEESLKK